MTTDLGPPMMGTHSSDQRYREYRLTDLKMDKNNSQHVSISKAFKKYDGARHEVYNEIKKELPLADLRDWLNEHN